LAVIIKSCEKRSLAHKCGIKAQDILVSINGNVIEDVLDYRFYIAENKLDIVVLRKGKEKKFTIIKDEYDDIGIEFDSYLMDKQHGCKNKCIFCFIDQLPRGLRKSLYFKDDDSRMSFLFGNYITLTNITRHEIDRIIKMHISPINISVHTANPELRCKMMGNKNAGEALKIIDEFKNAGIKMNCQIVLCKGINDGEKEALELVKLVRGMNCYINLIPYNETNNIEFKRSDYDTISKFYDILKKNKINATIRREFGSKISAACGQLRSKKED